jgi:hypothetical protein
LEELPASEMEGETLTDANAIAGTALGLISAFVVSVTYWRTVSTSMS